LEVIDQWEECPLNYVRVEGRVLHGGVTVPVWVYVSDGIGELADSNLDSGLSSGDLLEMVDQFVRDRGE
jgi:hypothetical protein